MKRTVALTLALASLSAPAWAGFDGRVWDDGRAEVAVYESERVVYDKPREFRETLIVVKEDLRLDTLVKADKPKETKTVRVFKLNQIQKFDTQNYPYSYMTSVFLRAADPAAVIKLTVGAQEACGNTFKLFTNPAGVVGTLLWHSYFDGEADGSARLEIQAGDLFDDGLPVSLRALKFRAGLEVKTRIWSNLTSNRATEAVPVPATIKVLEEDTIRSHAGTLPCWKVSVEREGAAPDTYWFEKAEPHILVRMAKADGSKRQLYGRARWSYWDRRLPRPNVLN